MDSSDPARVGDDEHSGEETVAEVRYDGAQERPSLAVVEAVAEVRDCEPVDLEPLYGVVDPDLLDSLAAGRAPTDDGPHVRFEYGGVPVEVRYGDGVVAADGH